MEGILFLIGGRLYTLIELLWRGHTPWSMFLLGGACFVIMGLLNEHIFSWSLSLMMQAIVSAVIITVLEFLTGCIVNILLGWDVWDYSRLPYNLYGQICLYYFLLWIPLSVAGIILDDWLRYIIYIFLRKLAPGMQKRERPHYKLFSLSAAV